MWPRPRWRCFLFVLRFFGLVLDPNLGSVVRRHAEL